MKHCKEFQADLLLFYVDQAAFGKKIKSFCRLLHECFYYFLCHIHATAHNDKEGVHVE